MREEQRYIVTAAILARPRKDVRLWTVTFVPRPRPAGLPFDADAGKEVVVTILPQTLEAMSFEREYTLAEIQALRAS